MEQVSQSLNLTGLEYFQRLDLGNLFQYLIALTGKDSFMIFNPI